MDEFIKADLFRYFGVINRKVFWKAFIAIPGFRVVYLIRKIQQTKHNSPSNLLFRYLYWRAYYKYGIQIPLKTKIGKGFYIGHFGCIVINQAAKIGDNCNIAHGVTIGQANRGGRKGTPIIGNRVWMGTGAVIVGAITIGDNVLIAPNAFVNIDVPPNSIAIGNPAKVISKPDPTAGYINNVLPQ